MVAMKIINRNNTIAKKFSVSLLLFLFAFCFELTAQTNYAISIISGPPIRISGISTPTGIQLTGAHNTFVRWTNSSGSEVGRGTTLYVTQPGTYYAQDVKVSILPNEGEVIFPTNAGSIEIKGLEHHISASGPNPLDKNNSTTQLCYFSNAFSNIAPTFSTQIKWHRGFFEDGNIDVCRYVNIPGIYTISVQYFYKLEASEIVTANFVSIQSDPSAPIVELPIGSYNPVTPPDIIVTNYNLFSSYRVFIDDNFVGSSTSAHIETRGPGRYRIEGISNGTAASCNDFFIFQGDIPIPLIFASNGGVLSYENPEVKISATSGYNGGYTWYKNDAVIDGASTNTLTLSKVDDVGVYTLKGCATYPDGTSQCKTSLPIEITGEILHVNFFRKKTTLIENVTDPAQLDVLPATQVNMATVFADGLGRNIQTVQRSGSPLANDIVLEKRYDQFGREVKQILPFAIQKSDGFYNYILKSLQPIKDFYLTKDKIAHTDFPFGETQFEASPFNRVLKQGFAGEDWQLNTTHVKSLAYLSNKQTDNIWIWTSTSQGLSASSFYPDGSLSMVEVMDENGHIAREYKDKLGKSILNEKVIENGVLRTYSVFDDLGRLINVVPPKTTAALSVSQNANIANDVLARECYSYRYDERGRQIVKNIPGAGSTYIVYDKWDRVVLTQTSNQRSRNKWSFNKYEVQDRLVLTGEIILAGDNIAATQAVNTFYANVFSNPILRYEETGGSIHGYTNRSFPVLSNECQVYTVSYYDDYSFLSQFGNAYQFSPESVLGLTSSSTNTQGLITGTKTIILGTCNFLKTAIYFDNKHRMIQGITENHMGGTDKVSSKLDFIGRLTDTKIVHNGLQVVTIQERHTYDAQGRKLQIYEKVNNESEVLRCDYHYNELGQMVEKNIHSTDGNKFLQSVDYVYNIRGWLSQQNPSETESNTTYPDQYGFELSYTSAPSGGAASFQPSFNGNITAFTETRPATVEVAGTFKSAYTFVYDYRDQLKQANYSQASNPILMNGYFDMPIITYDQNGNILTLQRKGTKTDGTNGLIDKLNYLYNGNQLIRVDDIADQVKGFVNK
jgi:hypothetical protein